jgi:type 1 glutamine amidotransferase
MKLRSFKLVATISATLCLVLFSTDSFAGAKTKRILFFSKSSGFEHSVIKKSDGELSFAEKILKEIGDKNNIEFTFTKDGRLFTPENLAKYDAFFFYTTGDLTEAGKDGNPPMSPEGKAAFLNAIKNGKGFIGTHSATDTFHSPGNKEHSEARFKSDGDNADPYVKMIGAEFILHGKQQSSRMIVADKKFPGISAVNSTGATMEKYSTPLSRSRTPRKGLGAEDLMWNEPPIGISANTVFAPVEEWYSLKDFAPNLHVLLIQDTSKMEGSMYQRPPYPATWARMDGKGRVFYTSMGHREDIWTNPVFQKVLTGGINWAVKNVDADVKPNIEKVTPKANELPPSK